MGFTLCLSTSARQGINLALVVSLLLSGVVPAAPRQPPPDLTENFQNQALSASACASLRPFITQASVAVDQASGAFRGAREFIASQGLLREIRFRWMAAGPETFSSFDFAKFLARHFSERSGERRSRFVGLLFMHMMMQVFASAGVYEANLAAHRAYNLLLMPLEIVVETLRRIAVIRGRSEWANQIRELAPAMLMLPPDSNSSDDASYYRYNSADSPVLSPRQKGRVLTQLRAYIQILQQLRKIRRPGDELHVQYVYVGEVGTQSIFTVRVLGTHNLASGQRLALESDLGNVFVVQDVRGDEVTLKATAHSEVARSLPQKGTLIASLPLEAHLHSIIRQLESRSVAPKTFPHAHLGWIDLTRKRKSSSGNGRSFGDLEENAQRAIDFAGQGIPVLLLESPPGTEVTKTLAPILLQAMEHGQRVLVVSATEHPLATLVNQVKGELPILRLAMDSSKLGETIDVWPGNTTTPAAAGVIETYQAKKTRWKSGTGMGGRVIAVRLSDLKSAVLPKQIKDLKSDILIMLDCGRLRLSEVLPAMLSLEELGQVIWVGDTHRQRPPPLGDEERLLLKRAGVLPDHIAMYESGIFENLLTLHNQGNERKPPHADRILLRRDTESANSITQFLSQIFYEGQLHAMGSAEGGADSLVMINTADLASEDERQETEIRPPEGITRHNIKPQRDYQNDYSANQVMLQIERLHEAHGVPYREIQVATPYPAQAQLLGDLIEDQYGYGSQVPRVSLAEDPNAVRSRAAIFDPVRSNITRDPGRAADRHTLARALSLGWEYVVIVWDQSTFTGEPQPGDSEILRANRTGLAEIQDYFRQHGRTSEKIIDLDPVQKSTIPVELLIAGHRAALVGELSSALKPLESVKSISQAAQWIERLQTQPSDFRESAQRLCQDLIFRLDSLEGSNDAVAAQLAPVGSQPIREGDIGGGTRQFLSWWHDHWRQGSRRQIQYLLNAVAHEPGEPDTVALVQIAKALPSPTLRATLEQAVVEWAAEYVGRQSADPDHVSLAREIAADVFREINTGLAPIVAFPDPAFEKLNEQADGVAAASVVRALLNEQNIQNWVEGFNSPAFRDRLVEEFDLAVRVQLLRVRGRLAALGNRGARLERYVKILQGILDPIAGQKLQQKFDAEIDSEYKLAIAERFDGDSPLLGSLSVVGIERYYADIARDWQDWGGRRISLFSGNRGLLNRLETRLKDDKLYLDSMPGSDRMFDSTYTQMLSQLSSAKQAISNSLDDNSSAQAAILNGQVIEEMKRLWNDPLTEPIRTMPPLADFTSNDEIKKLSLDSRYSVTTFVTRYRKLMNDLRAKPTAPVTMERARTEIQRCVIIFANALNCGTLWSVSSITENGFNRPEMNNYLYWILKMDQIMKRLVHSQLSIGVQNPILGPHDIQQETGPLTAELEVVAPTVPPAQFEHLLGNFEGLLQDYALLYRGGPQEATLGKAIADVMLDCRQLRERYSADPSSLRNSQISGLINDVGSAIWAEKLFRWYGETPRNLLPVQQALVEGARSIYEAARYNVEAVDLGRHLGLQTEPLVNAMERTPGSEGPSLASSPAHPQAAAAKSGVPPIPNRVLSLEATDRVLSRFQEEMERIENYPVIRPFSGLKGMANRDPAVLMKHEVGEVLRMRDAREPLTSIKYGAFLHQLKEVRQMASIIAADLSQHDPIPALPYVANSANIYFALLDQAYKHLIRLGIIEGLLGVKGTAALEEIRNAGNIPVHVRSQNKDTLSPAAIIEALAALRRDITKLKDETVAAAPVLKPTLVVMQDEMLRMLSELEKQPDPAILVKPYGEWGRFMDRLSTLVGLQRVYPWHVGPTGRIPHFESLFNQIAADALEAENSLGIEFEQADIQFYFGLTLSPLDHLPGPPLQQFKRRRGVLKSMTAWAVLALAHMEVFHPQLLNVGVLAFSLGIGFIQYMGMVRAGIAIAADSRTPADRRLSAWERTWYNVFHEPFHRWLEPLGLHHELEEFIAFGSDMITWVFVPAYYHLRGDGADLVPVGPTFLERAS